MELLLQAIEKKLLHVDGERKRWMQYKEEHEQARDNLCEFPKSFHKQILVPIGSKALMPGHLYHTNEIFVSMYQGMFVKCSADKALSVCEHRLGKANKWIDALNAEHKMYKDRLELPADESIFGNIDSAQEIIEEYNEEDEKRWREQHKIRMREHKQAEAKERQQLDVCNDIDINGILEQAELLEELENDLEMLNVDDDEHLMQHLQSSNENMKSIEYREKSESNEAGAQPEVDAIDSDCDSDSDGDCDSDEIGSKEFLSINAATTGLSTEEKIKYFEDQLQKTREFFMKTKCTVRNFDEFTDKCVTEECLKNAIDELQEAANNTIESSTTIPNTDANRATKQLLNANESQKFLSRCDFDEIERDYAEKEKSTSELLIFYKSQLRNFMKSIADCTIDIRSRDEKRQMYEFLTDRISSLRDDIQREKLFKLEQDFMNDDFIDVNLKRLNRNSESNDDVTGKRKICFAVMPTMVTFHEDDEPSRISQESVSDYMDTTFEFFNSPCGSNDGSVRDDDENGNVSNQHRPVISTNDCDKNVPMNKCNDTVINRVENWLSVVSNEATGPDKPTTLILTFDHSPNTCTVTASDDDDAINSPLDIYKQFESSGQQSSSSVSIQNRNQFNEIGNQKGNDSISAGDKSLEIPNFNQKPTKSILKKKILVDTENRTPSTRDDIEEKDAMDDNEPTDELPGFIQVLGDIVERSNDQIPSQIISTNSEPKKRVSLFKKSRAS